MRLVNEDPIIECPKKGDFTIIVDTREQYPYTFAGQNVIVKKLDEGDYSLEGFEKRIVWERKSLDDFIGTVVHNFDTFEKELQRAQAIEDFNILIESNIIDIYARKYYSQAHPHSILGRICSIRQDYHIPCFLLGNRQLAQNFLTRYFLRFIKREKEKEREEKRNARTIAIDLPLWPTNTGGC